MKNFLIFLVTLNCFAQNALNESELKEDYDILKTVIAELSPALTLDEKKELYAYFNSKESALDGKSMSSIDFFRFLMDLKAKTKMDEHGSISLSEEVMRSIISQKKALFSLPILIINEKFIVNHENLPIPFGSIIHEINDQTSTELLSEMLKTNDAFRLRNLETSFDVLYLIKYGTPKNFKVLYTPPNSTKVETVWLEPIDIESRETLHKTKVYPLQREQLKNVMNTSYFPEQDAYYIQLNTFNDTIQDKYLYKKFEDEFSNIFKTIDKQHPKNLIVDLRYNQGGRMVIPALFYSFMAKKNFVEYMQLMVPDFDLPYKNHIKAIEGKKMDENEIETYMEDTKKPFKKVDDHYEHTFIDNATIKPNKRAFEGNVYLLIGGYTFSAASYFVALYKSQERGKIIGEEIGGSHLNITAGTQIGYELPNSKIRLSMPLGILKFSPELSTKIPEKKIMPDVIISEEVKYRHLLNKEDWDLQEALKLIN